jgi:fatty-acyl-CoA synthase
MVSQPLVMSDITPGRLLAQRAAAEPEGVAIEFPRHGSRLTYAEWNARSQALARSFVDLGLSKGERLALLSENRVEWSLVQMAAALAGLILVPINTHSRSEDLHFARSYRASG